MNTVKVKFQSKDGKALDPIGEAEGALYLNKGDKIYWSKEQQATVINKWLDLTKGQITMLIEYDDI